MAWQQVRRLGHLEAEVMERLWSWNRAASVREVLEDLQQDRKLAYTTVMTVMDNLHRKGYLQREKAGRAYVYRTTRSRESHTAEMMESVLASSKDPGAALLHFVEQMAPDEVALLEEALEDLGRRDGRAR